MRSPRPAATCRSRQLYEAFVLPPTNHLANGSFHSSALVNGSNQCRSVFASFAQNAGGSAAASSHNFWYSSSDLIRARAENSRDGGNSRLSCITESSWPDGDWAMRNSADA